eukprot:CAMPEP_0116884116 /NCGR_PEP_ID=MMETSP0463-20121206/16875_1 /TAXON_ID=181622 /ORGANISM="Strombidinopsis sp, Strain SopsisLIS2011" /LENGTH=41 /DNA_ID= /DNA_START= /DNA_END= /DNA_ORIENTATION=
MSQDERFLLTTNEKAAINEITDDALKEKVAQAERDYELKIL